MPSPTHHSIVLVVEDQILVRQCAVDHLNDAGFDVISAANAQEALQAFRSCEGVAAVFTDIGMPGPIDGLALAQRIFQLSPTVRLIVTSGRSQPDAADMPTGARFLPKPYDCLSLSAVIKAA